MPATPPFIYALSLHDALPISHRAARLAALEDLEAREVGRAARRARAPERFRARFAREALERRPAAHRERLREARVGGVPHDAPAPRHDAHQVVKLALDGADVRIDVRV